MSEPFTRESAREAYATNAGDVDPELLGVEVCYSCSDGGKAPTAPARAEELVHGDRQAAYGHPLDDFTRTGRLWGAILGLEGDVPPELVGLCLAAVKIAREVNRHGEDNLVDLAGYAETVRLVHEERARR